MPSSAIAIRGVLRRRRRRLAMLLAVCALGGAVAVAHSGMEGMHMPAMTAWCLAVIPLAAGLVGAAALCPRPLVRAPLALLAPRPPLWAPVPTPRARAGPLLSVVLRL